MKRILLILTLVFCIFCIADAQLKDVQSFHTNAIISNPDQYLLDSLKQIVKRGIRYDLFGKKHVERQMRYINACISLGKYYEKQFNSGKLNTMKQSIAYYQKVVDTYGDMGNYNYANTVALSAIAAISRKLSTVYFKGIGVKKDIVQSYWYAKTGIGNMGSLYNYYSLRYFNKLTVLFKKVGAWQDGAILSYGFLVNPFADGNFRAMHFLNDPMLKQLAADFYSRDSTGELTILLRIYSGASMKAQSETSSTLANVKSLLVKQQHIKAEKIYTESEVYGGPETYTYKGFKCRYLEVIFKPAITDSTNMK